MAGRARRRTSPTGSQRRSSASARQLVVGLDPRPDLLPVELSGEAHLGRAEAAEACARFCRGLVDAVAPYVVAVKPQSAFFEALGADGVRALRGRLRLRARRRAAGDRRREARRHRLDRARVRRRVRRARDDERSARRRGHASTRTSAATRSTRSSPRAGATAPASSASSRPRTPAAPTSRTSSSPTAAGLAAGRRARRASGATDLVGERGLSAVGAVDRRDASRARWARRAGCCRARSCSCPASAPRGRRRPTSRAPSRAAPRARSSTSSRDVIYAFRRLGDGLAHGRRRRGVEATRARSGPSPAGRDRRGSRAQRRELARYGVPAAFLAAATIAVLLIKAGLGQLGRRRRRLRRPPTTDDDDPATTTTSSSTTTPIAAPHDLDDHDDGTAGQYYVDPERRHASASIAASTARPSTSSMRLNPGVDPTALQRRAADPRRLTFAPVTLRLRRRRGRGSRPRCGPHRPARRRVSARAFLVENAVDRRGPRTARRAWARVPIASITKLMTVIVALEHCEARRRRARRAPTPRAVGESTHQPARGRAHHRRRSRSRAR